MRLSNDGNSFLSWHVNSLTLAKADVLSVRKLLIALVVDMAMRCSAH